MKNTYSTTLFSQMVSTIETAINMDIECGTYDQLADALNLQGFTNSRGQSFSGSSLQKYLHRIRHPRRFTRVQTKEFEELYDAYYPKRLEQNPLGYVMGGECHVG